MLKNNYIPSPTHEKAPGLEEIPVLKVFLNLFPNLNFVKGVVSLCDDSIKSENYS